MEIALNLFFGVVLVVVCIAFLMLTVAMAVTSVHDYKVALDERKRGIAFQAAVMVITMLMATAMSGGAAISQFMGVFQ